MWFHAFIGDEDHHHEEALQRLSKDNSVSPVVKYSGDLMWAYEIG